MDGMDLSEREPTYELHHDRLMESYTIREVREIGPFDSREAAKQWMLARPTPRGAVDLSERTKQRMADLGIPAGADVPKLIGIIADLQREVESLRAANPTRATVEPRWTTELTVCEVHGPVADLSRRCPDCDRPLRTETFESATNRGAV